MTAFREPSVRYGHRTLTAIVAILGMLLAGVAYLAAAYRIGAMDQTHEGYRSVLSQLASAVVGDGILYYLAIGSLLCVLALSANTSFVDFPRLCRSVAEDGFLPRSFTVAGRRLVFSVGILYLAATAGLLLIAFGGITEHLIPLFAIGAFLTFTLSQTGMVFHWRRLMRQGSRKRERVHLWINAVGALTTGIALLVITLAKFRRGAWITVLVLPIVITALKLIRRYYDSVAQQVADRAPLQLGSCTPPVVLVMIDEWNKLTDKALAFAMSLSPDVIGVHLTDLEGPESDSRDRELQSIWQTYVGQPARDAGMPPPRLMVFQARYRTIHEPVLKVAHTLEEKLGTRSIAVLIPEIVKRHWYEHLLHINRAQRLRTQLLKHGGDKLTVINVPWRLDDVPAPT
jgi:hypothetical protein